MFSCPRRGYRQTAPITRPKLDPFTAQIDLWLAEDKARPRKQHHTAKRIIERLRDECGFDGGHAIDKDYVRADKRGSLTKPGRFKQLSAGLEYRRSVRDYCLCSWSEPKHSAVLSVSYGAGLRASEVCSLKVSDIDSDRMLIYVDEAKVARTVKSCCPLICWILRGGSVCLNWFRVFLKWFSALVAPVPRLAPAD